MHETALQLLHPEMLDYLGPHNVASQLDEMGYEAAAELVAAGLWEAARASVEAAGTGRPVELPPPPHPLLVEDRLEAYAHPEDWR